MLRYETRILTPCPPRKHCWVCDGRLTGIFGRHDKRPKYRHQAQDNGRMAMAAIRDGASLERVFYHARRAATYADMLLAMDDVRADAVA